MENINSWKDLQWAQIEQTVFRLQLRIYKAATNQEFEKMYKLQKLLISSQSAKYFSVLKVTEGTLDKNILGGDRKVFLSLSEKYKLANHLKLNRKSFPIRKIYVPEAGGSKRALNRLTMEDRAKQMLAYLALCPQWETEFKTRSYGFRTGESALDAVETVFLGLFQKPKWVLNTDISKRFDYINYEYLIEKCHTFPEMRKQIRFWLKTGILEGEENAFPEMEILQGGVIFTLLANIALNGLNKSINNYINNLSVDQLINHQNTTFVRYGDNCVLMHQEKKVLENLKEVILKFLEPIGLELNPRKTRMIHTLNLADGFTFLGFDISQRIKWVKMRKVVKKGELKQTFITLITPSKKDVKQYKLKIREIIRRYRGVTQELLIQKLNPIIKSWALSKRTQASSKTFQALDQYLFTHLWKWAQKRHPKMASDDLKKKYWYQVGNRNWVFGIKKNVELLLELEYHSKIPIQRHFLVNSALYPTR